MWRWLVLVGSLASAPAVEPAAAPSDREEEVSFDEAPATASAATRVRTEVEPRAWLLVLPLLVLAVLAWNVRWRRGEVMARYQPPIGGRRLPKGRSTSEQPAEDF